jgi:hypothetical protein
LSADSRERRSASFASRLSLISRLNSCKRRTISTFSSKGRRARARLRGLLLQQVGDVYVVFHVGKIIEAPAV